MPCAIEEQRMAAGYQKIVDPGGPEMDKKTAEKTAKTGEDDACRCKETAQMTPRELLKLMMSDLAFWKKNKKE